MNFTEPNLKIYFKFSALWNEIYYIHWAIYFICWERGWRYINWTSIVAMWFSPNRNTWWR